MYTVRCWQCGQRIEEEQAVRVNVQIGRTLGRFGTFGPFGTQHNPGWIEGRTHDRVDFCQACVTSQRRSALIRVAAIILLLILAGIFLHWIVTANGLVFPIIG